MLLTLGTEFARRRWEDQRRWLDVKRKAYFTFLVATNSLFNDIKRFAGVKHEISGFERSLATLQHEFEHGKAGPDQQAEVDRLRTSIAYTVKRQKELEPRVAKALAGLEEVAADMFLLSSGPLLEVVKSHKDLVFLSHEVFIAAAQTKIKPQAVSDKFASEYDQSLKSLTKRMRHDLKVK
jgi:hypothetical protein